MKKIALACLLCGLLLTGCATAPTPEPVSRTDTDDQTTSPDVDPAEVLAWIDGRPITVTDFELEMARRGANTPGFFSEPEERQALLDEMIRTESLVAMARREGFDQDPEIVSAFKRILSNKYQQATLESRLEAIRITDEDVEQFYLANQEQYMTPARVRAAIIFVEIRSRATAERRAELEQKAAQALAEARQLDAETVGFGELSRKYSDDTASKYVAGVIGWLYETRAANYKWGPEVVDAIFNLENPGDLGPLVHTDRGIYLVKAIEKEDQKPLSLKRTADGIRHRLLREERARLRDQFFADLMAEIDVERRPEVLDTVEPPDSARQPRENLRQQPPSLPGESGG